MLSLEGLKPAFELRHLAPDFTAVENSKVAGVSACLEFGTEREVQNWIPAPLCPQLGRDPGQATSLSLKNEEL